MAETSKNTSDKNRVKRYGEVVKVILAVIGAAGICATFILMPGLAKAVPLFRARKPYQKNKIVQTALKRLHKRSLINVWFGSDGQEKVKLTKKGHEELIKYQLRSKILKRPRRWDKKWRIIIFDIPVEYNKVRDGLRLFLKNNDFVRLQDSVWIFPYPCEEIVELLRSALGVRSETIYLTCDRFPDDKWLCKNFKLSKHIKT